jgi:hypothetical protein
MMTFANREMHPHSKYIRGIESQAQAGKIGKFAPDKALH